MQHQILGFSAHKQGGKTTAVRAILDLRPTAFIIPIAGALKDVVRHFIPADWPLATSALESDVDKNTKLPCGKTVRELLQLVGTDWFRHLWPDVWINAWRAKVAECGASVIILVPDVRFPNELMAIQEMGGHVIRLTRTPFPEDRHESETALDGNERASMPGWEGYRDAFKLRPFDVVIDNRAMSIEQQNAAVLDLVRQKGWISGI